MLRLIVLSCVLVACLGAPRALRKPSLDGRIVGGSEADIADFPFQLSFEQSGSHICGASIISADWALTAAHCADGQRVANVRFRSGSSKRGSGGTLHSASQIIIHSKYDSYDQDYDISLIKVSTPFVNGVGTKAIALTSTEPAVGSTATASGWGTTSSGASNLPTTLRSVKIPIISRSSCSSKYSAYGGVTDRMICAALPTGGADSCQGDSGGPLTVGGVLVGIVSWGVGCANANYPGVYSNVAVLRDWVRQNSGV